MIAFKTAVLCFLQQNKTFIYSFFSLARSWTIIPVGCYRDSYAKPRPLPELIADFRDTIDRTDTNKTIQACAVKARERGFHFFGIQFYTECWSGTGAEENYGRDGISMDCENGVGKSGANFVYSFSDYGKHRICLISSHVLPLLRARNKKTSPTASTLKVLFYLSLRLGS